MELVFFYCLIFFNDKGPCLMRMVVHSCLQNPPTSKAFHGHWTAKGLMRIAELLDFITTKSYPKPTEIVPHPSTDFSIFGLNETLIVETKLKSGGSSTKHNETGREKANKSLSSNDKAIKERDGALDRIKTTIITWSFTVLLHYVNTQKGVFLKSVQWRHHYVLSGHPSGFLHKGIPWAINLQFSMNTSVQILVQNFQ